MADKKATKAAYMREYRKRNPEKYRKIDREKAAKDRAKDPAAFITRANERSRRYYERLRSRAKTPEEIERKKAGARARYLRWKAKNPERVKEITRRAAMKYYNADPIRGANAVHERRAKCKAGGVSKAEWAAIVEQYNGLCAYCGRRPERLEMDHVRALSKGGLHEPANVVPACRSCNASKGDEESPKCFQT